MANDLFEQGLRSAASYGAQQPEMPVVEESQFVRGARGGTYGMASSLRNAAGLAGEALGSQDFAKGQYAEGAAMAQRAQESGARIGSYSDLEKQGFSLRNMTDFAAGTIGGAAPSLALGVGAGLGARTLLGGLARTTAAYAPMETGDVVAKMRKDNGGAPLTADQMTDAVTYGPLSAAAQSVVPAIIGGKLTGRAAGSALGAAEGNTLRQALGRNAFEIPLEGAMEATGGIIKGYGANKAAPVDWIEARDNAIGGMIGGSPMAGVGAVADYGHGRSAQIGSAVQGASDAIGKATAPLMDQAGDLAGGASDAALAAAGKAKVVGKDAFDDVANLAEQAFKGAVEGFKASELGQTLPERTAATRAAAEALLADPDLPANIRKGVEEATKSAGDKANQAYVWAAGQASKAAASDTAKGLGAAGKDIWNKATGRAPVEEIKGAIDGLNTDTADEIGKASRGEFMGDPQALASATPEQAAQMVADNDKTIAQKLSSRATDIAARAGEAWKDAEPVREALKNMGDPANRKIVGDAVMKFDGVQRAKDGVERLRKSIDETDFMKDVNAKMGGAKQSSDFSGIEQVIRDELIPAIPQHITEDPETFKAITTEIRRFIDLAAGIQDGDKGPAHRQQMLSAINDNMTLLLGDDAESILGNVYHAIGEADPDKARAFFGNLKSINDKKSSYASMTQAMWGMHPKGETLPSAAGNQRFSAMAKGLQAWASTGRDAANREPGADFNDRQVMAMLSKEFGEANAQKLIKMAEKEALKVLKVPGTTSGRVSEQRESMEGDDNEFQAEQGEESGPAFEVNDATPKAMYVGKNGEPAGSVAPKGKKSAKGSDLYLGDEEMVNDPGIDGLVRSVAHQKSSAPDQATAQSGTETKIKTLQAKYPGYDVSFVSVNDYLKSVGGDREAAKRQFPELAGVAEGDWGTYGYIKLNGKESSDGLQPWEQRAVKLDTGKYSTSPSRLDFSSADAKGKSTSFIGDAVKLTRHMDKTRPYNDADNNSREHRLGRMFMEGYGTLATQFGGAKQELSPDFVIAREHGKAVTVGDIEKLGFRPKSDYTGVAEKSREGREFTSDELRVHETTKELSDLELNRFALRKHRQYDAAVAKMDAATASEVIAENKAANKYMSEKAIDREVAKRGRESARQLAAGVTELNDLIGVIDAEQAKRGGKSLKNDLLEGEERTEIGKDEQIHTAAMGNRADELVNRVSMDGSTVTERQRAADAGLSYNYTGEVQALKKDSARMVRELADLKDPVAKAELKAKMAQVDANRQSFQEKNGRLTPKGEEVFNQTFATSIEGWLSTAGKGSKNNASVAKSVAARAQEIAAAAPYLRASDRNNLMGAFGLAKRSDTMLMIETLHENPDVQAAMMMAKAAAPANLADEVSERQAYLDNPPANYSTAEARETMKWGEQQMAAITKQLEGVKGEARDALADSRSDVRRLVAKAKEMVEADGVLESRGLAEGAPPPKPQAASPQATRSSGETHYSLEKAQAAGDPASIAADLVRQFAPNMRLTVETSDTRGNGSLTRNKDGSYTMRVKPGLGGLNTAAVVAHEFGHALQYHAFEAATPEVKAAVQAAYDADVASMAGATHAELVVKFGHVASIRAAMESPSSATAAETIAKRDAQAGKSGYTLSFNEWFANQVSKYATSSDFSGASPETRSFWQEVVAKLQEVYQQLVKGTKAHESFAGWMDSLARDAGKKAAADRLDADKPGPWSHIDAKRVQEYIGRVLGPDAAVEFKDLMHAGEFTHQDGVDLIRLSRTALDPFSTAHHEALHAFFQRLGDKGLDDVKNVLEKAAASPTVQAQLMKLLAHSPEAQAQLGNPEERAAYMYQFWAAGKLKLGTPAASLFQRIQNAIQKVLGIWSNDERAEHILSYFHSGGAASVAATNNASTQGMNRQQRRAAAAQGLGNAAAVRAALMGTGTFGANANSVAGQVKKMAGPISRLYDTLMGAGSERMRETGIPALITIAERIKSQLHGEGGDVGYLTASRVAHAQAMTGLNQAVSALGTEHYADALESLQTGVAAATPEARLIAGEVKKVLQAQREYMVKAGVKVGDLGPDYFPRVYDPYYISTHQKEFVDLLNRHGYGEEVMHSIVANNGADFGVDIDRPGMQAGKHRVLDLPANEVAEFLGKDLLKTADSYLQQSTRRAEWARRFKDDSSGLHALLDTAKKQGATDDQLNMAERYVKGVTGTLGDDINPTLRRLQGNMMVYQNVRLLPLALFSSVFVDPMGVVVRGGEVSDAWNAFKRGIREIPKGLRGDTSVDADEQLSLMMGTVQDAALTHALSSSYLQGMVGGTAARINDKFFQYNMMEQYNRSMRVGATVAAVKFIERHATTMGKHSQRFLEELGLMPGDVQMNNGAIALTEAEGLSPAQAGRVKMAVNKWVDGAVLRPDSADKPIWMNDPHYAIFAHLKQFTFAFQHTIIDRVWHEIKHGNYTPAMALASYVPLMIAADFIKGAAQNGGDEPEWKKNWGVGDYVLNGIERAGLHGKGQFFGDAMKDIQMGGIGLALLGPTVEQASDAIEVLGGRKSASSFVERALPANAVYSGYID